MYKMAETMEDIMNKEAKFGFGFSKQGWKNNEDMEPAPCHYASCHEETRNISLMDKQAMIGMMIGNQIGKTVTDSFKGMKMKNLQKKQDKLDVQSLKNQQKMNGLQGNLPSQSAAPAQPKLASEVIAEMLEKESGD